MTFKDAQKETAFLWKIVLQYTQVHNNCCPINSTEQEDSAADSVETYHM